LEFRTVDHTADIGIEVEAASLTELFEAAARGMFSLITDLTLVSSVVTREVEINSGDLEELMFKWLNELLFLLSTELLLFSRFDVRMVREDRLEAIVGGEGLDLAKHEVTAEMKAATYHDLEVRDDDDSWFARVIFDV
jgi:SHS2 domain-containing protein